MTVFKSLKMGKDRFLSVVKGPVVQNPSFQHEYAKDVGKLGAYRQRQVVKSPFDIQQYTPSRSLLLEELIMARRRIMDSSAIALAV